MLQSGLGWVIRRGSLPGGRRAWPAKLLSIRCSTSKKDTTRAIGGSQRKSPTSTSSLAFSDGRWRFLSSTVRSLPQTRTRELHRHRRRTHILALRVQIACLLLPRLDLFLILRQRAAATTQPFQTRAAEPLVDPVRLAHPRVLDSRQYAPAQQREDATGAVESLVAEEVCRVLFR